MRRAHLLAGLLCLFGAVGCAPAASDDIPVETGVRHDAVIRARSADIDIGIAPGSEGEGTLTLELFDDVHLQAELSSRRRGDAGMSWIGRVAGIEPSEVVLSQVGDRLAGTVRAGDALYQILPTREGQLVIELDEARIPDEVPPIAPDGGGVLAEPTPTSEGAGPSLAPTRVDVMVVYTGDAFAAAGDEMAMAATIELAAMETNLGYAQSGVAIDLHIVHTAQVTYDESAFDWATTLLRLSGQGDGFMDEVHALRDAYGADHVVLIVETVGPATGIGYLLGQGYTQIFDDYAFSVVSRPFATGAYTFGHELGHNMGANHDHDNAQGVGFFSDSYGLQAPAYGFRTIMAYNCQGCPRVNHWSNPAVSYAGGSTGVVDWANNARTLNHTASIVAAFREQLMPPPAHASMISPEPGATLPSEDVTFAWTDAGAIAYRLTIGDEPGDTDYLDAVVEDVSLAVEDLPAAGETLYARLWTKTADTWLYEDYVYQAAVTELYGASLAFPDKGSTLDASAVPFFWWDSGAEGYRLSVGTPTDPTAYFDRDLGRDHWAFVPGLPHDGSPLVARITAIGEGNAEAISDTPLLAYSAPAWVATLVEPAPGAILGAKTTFAWKANQRAEEYWLVVRDDDGTPIASRSTRRRKLTIKSLPVDGRRIAVTLHARIGAAWADSSAGYQMEQ